MNAGRAKNCDQQIGCSVQDFRVFLELGNGIDGTVELDHSHDFVQRTKRTLDGGDQINARGARKRIALFRRILAPEAALRDFPSIGNGALPEVNNRFPV